MFFFGRPSKSKEAVARRKPSAFMPRLESLEDRYNPGAYNFVGGAVGAANSWSTLANWTDNGGAPIALPGAADDVTIGANKTANFDVAANVTIKSLTMGAGATLDLGKVTAGGITLTVSGGNSTLGTANMAAATIKAQNSAVVANNANLTFSGAGSLTMNVFTASMAQTNAGGGLAGLSNLNINTKTVSVTGTVQLQANTTIGDGTNATDMTVNNGAFSITPSRWGNFTINTKSSVIITGGGGFTKDPNNNSPIVNKGNLVINVGAGNQYKIGPAIKGNQIIIMSGKVGAVIQGDGTTNVIVWSGAEIDSTGGTSTFGAGDHINFVSDGDTTGINLDGAFLFNAGASEYFHAFELSKPNLANIDTWMYGSFSTTPISYAVNLNPDGNGVESWTGNDDTVTYDVYVGSSTIKHVTLNVTGSGTFNENGGTLTVNTTGSTPSSGTTVPLITSASSSIVASFASYVYTGYTWSIWSPGPHTFGLTTNQPPPVSPGS
ncbi:autotransporter outer membrane beta-barrel domain-containing protein [Frigoriglobus tundricola]|uniref:Uncharacterized protein n=1 Tax=Frigoriglobus tundricola TaxID=2774151 RepID=A0A6M5Z7Y1_9BACT|nr:hypothetical protein [Frigoriglobus tundricola]QJX01353.1 hypothetical protein FTUN_8997 [Frigoriglobus tundricola]